MEQILALEINMSDDNAYTVKIGELTQRLGLNAVDLVRICDIAVGTAYRACKNSASLKTCNKIYHGLKKAGYEIRWEDVVEID